MVKRLLTTIVLVLSLPLLGLRFFGASGSPAVSDCANNESAACTLNATRSASDADFVAGNIISGVNILNVTGTYAPSPSAPLETQSVTYAGSNSAGIVLTSPIATNTESAYTQVVASTSFNANRVIVILNGADGEGGRTYFVDLATGGAGSENVVIANMPLQIGGCAQCGLVFEFPIAIASGTRLALRVQANMNSASLYATVTLKGGATADAWFSTVTTYGANSSTTRGVNVDAGATANTEGAYSEIAASATCAAELFAFGNQSNQAETTSHHLFDFATGAAASEVSFHENYPLAKNAWADNLGVQTTPLFYKAISAARISVRSQSSTNNATSRLNDVIMFCLN